MKCPKCDKEMNVIKKSESKDARFIPNKKYKRTLFHCKEDDIWINLEVPAE